MLAWGLTESLRVMRQIIIHLKLLLFTKYHKFFQVIYVNPLYLITGITWMMSVMQMSVMHVC